MLVSSFFITLLVGLLRVVQAIPLEGTPSPGGPLAMSQPPETCVTAPKNYQIPVFGDETNISEPIERRAAHTFRSAAGLLVTVNARRLSASNMAIDLSISNAGPDQIRVQFTRHASEARFATELGVVAVSPRQGGTPGHVQFCLQLDSLQGPFWLYPTVIPDIGHDSHNTNVE